MQQTIAHLMWLEPEWTGSNLNLWSLLWWFDPMCQWLTCYFYVVFLHVVLRIGVFFFFLCRPQFTCHGITKTLKSFVMFIMRDQWHWSTLKHHWLFFFLHVHQHYTVIFCWFKECIFSFNVTPTLVIITVLSSCSCINIRLIFVCNTL